MLKNTKRTKIVCTLGPASEKEEVLTAVEKANSISQEHTALAEEIAATMDLQTSNIEEFNSTLNSLAKKVAE